MFPRVVLLPKRARPFYGRHPWVYTGAIASVEGDPADGDVVDLVAHAGQFIARGLFNSQSKIRVRLYSWSPDVPLDEAFFRARLEAAPDATVLEHCAWWAKQTGQPLSEATMWRAIRRLGWTHKKSRWQPANGTKPPERLGARR